MGRSLLAANFALLCSAIFSLRALLLAAAALPVPTDFEKEGAALLLDDASEAFGLLGSFSSPFFSLFSSVSKMLVGVSTAVIHEGE